MRKRLGSPGSTAARRPKRLRAAQPAADRASFAEELAAAVTGLVAKYHDETVTTGRDHRVVVAVHPRVKARKAAAPMTESQEQES